MHVSGFSIRFERCRGVVALRAHRAPRTAPYRRAPIIGRGLERACHRCVIVASPVLERPPHGANNCGSTGHDDILFVYMTDNTCIDYRPISVYP